MARRIKFDYILNAGKRADPKVSPVVPRQIDNYLKTAITRCHHVRLV
jgi:hypothetical protein